MNGGVLNQEDASRALSKLWDESLVQIKDKVGENFYAKYYPTDRHGRQWSSENPVGVVDHYTAGISERGVLRWFSKKPRGSRVGNSSAHAVISREGQIWLVVDPLKRIAWHARGVNSASVGIEHTNAGLLLRKTNGKFYYLGTRAYPEDRVGDLQEASPGKYWEPYTSTQLVSNVVFKRWLIWAFPEGQMKRGKFVDHQMVEPDRKVDCGPLWPLHALNDLVFSEKPIREMEWLKKNTLSVVDVECFKIEVAGHLLRRGPIPSPLK